MRRLPRSDSDKDKTMTRPTMNAKTSAKISEGRKTKILLRGAVLATLAVGLSGCYVAPYPAPAYPYNASPYYGGYYAPYSAYPYYSAPYYYGPSVGFVYRGGGRWR
jgi:hypothetical protein